MQTRIHEKFRVSEDDTSSAESSYSGDVRLAESILRACVHCGFCNATCPTYLELGDERDGPRGRIYLIGQLLETGTATERTRVHLDRCLTCRNCETTCPSGVRYGKLLDVARGMLERDLRRSGLAALQRRLIRLIVPYPRRFAALLGLTRAVRFALPARLRSKIPVADTSDDGIRNRRMHTPAARFRTHAGNTVPEAQIAGRAQTGQPAQAARRMIVLEGCAQAAATPNTNRAARRVLARLGIELLSPPRAGCCGALDFHLGEHDAGRAFMRANIDAWWPLIEAGAEAIVMTASGCGATVREYGQLLADDPDYAQKARRVAEMTRDIVEIVAGEDLAALQPQADGRRIAVHCPCTLQHAQRLGGTVESVLRGCGMQLVETAEAHLCCGSAGSYSLLQPQLSQRLRDRKLAALNAAAPDMIVTANVGCQLHLASGTALPVRHWIEALDAALPE